MTDIPPTEPAAAPVFEPRPTPVLSLSDGQMASAREHWIGLGLDAAAFDAAAGGDPALPTGAGDPAPADPAIQTLLASKTPQVSTEQAAAMEPCA